MTEVELVEVGSLLNGMEDAAAADSVGGAVGGGQTVGGVGATSTVVMESHFGVQQQPHQPEEQHLLNLLGSSADDDANYLHVFAHNAH